ncbi:single-stranded DNA-binding protein [bacterium]|nr:single-stranded DNA-binding protein [bacterium]
MGFSLNRVQLGGNVGVEPSQFKGVVRFTLATEEKWLKGGEWHKRTTWHTVVAFHPDLQERIIKYVRKGALVYIEGSIYINEWTDERTGTKNESYQIRASKVQVILTAEAYAVLREARGVERFSSDY